MTERCTEPRPAPPDAKLFALLAALGIAYETIEHPPIFTVAEGRDLRLAMPGAHTKNLFLRDKRGALALLSAHQDTVVELGSFAKAAGYGRLSFAAADALFDILGVRAGAVTPLALINDAAGRVRFFLDDALWRADRINVHPLRNDATTGLAPAGLARLLAALERDWRIVRFSPAGHAERIDAPPRIDHIG